MEKNCLVLTTFSGRDLQLKDVLKEVFSSTGFNVLHLADLPPGTTLEAGVSRLLKEAQVVVADISQLNPNILFEVGFAEGAGIPVLLVADTETKVPFDLTALPLIRYDKRKPPDEKVGLNVLAELKKITTIPPPPLVRPTTRVQKETKKVISENPFGFLFSDTMELDKIWKVYVKPPFFENFFGPETIVLTGPRGCGKTMLLQMMRHQSNQCLADQSSLKQPHTLAFYVNFNSSFRFLGAEKKMFANKEFVTTYFNLLFLQAFVNDLDKLYREGKIALNEINLVLSVLSKMMGITETSLDSFPKLVSDIVRFICTTRQGSFLERSVQTNLSTKDFLSSFVGQLRNRSALFTKSTVAFLLDDYATDWLPEEVSQMINQIIFERTTNCCFKIAAIPGRQNLSLGYSHSLELGRDYVLINMALFDVFPYVKSREEFLRTILDKRLALSGLSMDSRFIFDSRPKSNEPVDYSGIANLARLSNSDIRTVIALCNHMINSEGTVGIPISRETQNKVIRNYSRTLIEELKSGLEWGNYVADFLQQFMDFSQNLFLVSKQHERHPIPKERRFEGFKIDNEADIKLEAKKRLSWLVRSGVVQESRRSSRTEDFLIRKIFFPAFGVPISGRSYFVMLNAESCEIMLINPKKFWGQFSKRILSGSKNDKDLLDE